MQAIELSTTISAQGGNRLERQVNLRQALAAVAQAGTFAHVEDASAGSGGKPNERCHAACFSAKLRWWSLIGKGTSFRSNRALALAILGYLAIFYIAIVQ